MEKYINSLIRGFKKIFSKKYFAIVGIFIGIVTVLGVSYGYISIEGGWKLAIQLKLSKLYYSVTVDGVSTSQIVVPAGSYVSYYDVEITSLNDINTRYALTYEASSNLTVQVSSSSTNKGSGVIGIYSTGQNSEKKKTVRIAVTDSTLAGGTISLNVSGGYTWNPDNDIDIPNGYAIVTGLYDENRISLGLTLAEEIDTIMSCTPTVSTPCYYTNNSNNYLSYAGYTWRIIGTYLVDNEPVVKLILNDHLNNKVTYSNISSELTTFYSGLSDTSLIEGTPSSITKAEYDAIGGVDSYLYTKPDEEYWTGTQYYVGTSRGSSNLTSSDTAYVRPVIELKAGVISSTNTSSQVTLSNIVLNGSFMDNYRDTSNLEWDSTLNPNPPYRATGWSTGYYGAVTNPTTGYHAHFEPTTFGYMVAKFPNLNSVISEPNRLLVIYPSFGLDAGGIQPNHKYYYSMEVYSDTIGTENYAAYDINSNSVEFDKYISSASTINKWTRSSSLKTAPAGASASVSYNFYVYGHTGSEGTTYVKNIMLIDLTDAFGAGNEPSKAWCDENITFFEGTKNVIYKAGGIGTKTNPYTIEQGVRLSYANMSDATTNLREGYYKSGQTYTLDNAVSTDNNKMFNQWNVSGTGASLSGTTLTMGTSDTTISAIWDGYYLYTGTQKSYTAPIAGYYRVEVYNPNGAYAKGDIYLTANEKIFIDVTDDTTTPTSVKCFINSGVCGNKGSQNENNSRIMYADSSSTTSSYNISSLENSYMSGYAGTSAPSTTGNGTTKTDDPLHPTGKYFINGEFKFSSTNTVGKVIINYLGPTESKINTTLNGVRYIKDCVAYNSYDNYNQWREIQAIKDGTNIAKGKTVTGTVSATSGYEYTYVVDGQFSNGLGQNATSGSQCVTVDLGQEYDLDEINIWHVSDGRNYYSNVTSISADNSTFTTIIEEAGKEESVGKRVSAYRDVVNGYVANGLVKWYDGEANVGNVANRNTTTTTWKNMGISSGNGTVKNGSWGGNYYNFNGTSTWVNCGQRNYSAGVTLETVFTSTASTGNKQFLFNNLQSGGYAVNLYADGSPYGTFWGTSSDDYITVTSSALERNVMYSASFTYNKSAGNENLFVNGDKVASKNSTQSIGTTESSTVMAIGANPKGSSATDSYFKGRIYSVRMYSRGLTEEEIYHNYLYDKILGYID